MNNDSDMTTPATRGELAATENRLRGEIATTRDELVATEGRLRGEIVATRDELRGEIGASEDRLRGEIVATRHEMATDLARHANAIMEHNQTLITVFDEKYRSLPERVKRLEELVFAPKPKRSRRAAR